MKSKLAEAKTKNRLPKAIITVHLSGQSCDMEKIKNLSKKIRKDILNMALSAGASSSHFGGSLSTVEILSTLYKKFLKF